MLAFLPEVYIVLSRVCMIDYNKFNFCRRYNTSTIRIAFEVAQIPSLPKVLFGLHQHHDHLGFIYTSILSPSSLNVLKVVFMNLFYPDV